METQILKIILDFIHCEWLMNENNKLCETVPVYDRRETQVLTTKMMEQYILNLSLHTRKN